MIISGMQKLTLVDYPENMACLIFTQGCNFRCPFCHNRDLINGKNNLNKIEEKELFDYLDKRKGLIDGVCISGGEPLLQKDIDIFIKKIKNKGYKVKLDTNGSNPLKLKEIIDNNLIDYVAMDIKNSFEDYDKTAGTKVNIDLIKQSIKILKESNIDYEFRTTVVKEFHNIKNIEEILKYIGPKPKYYIQNYRECENVLKKGLTSFEEHELIQIKEQLKKDYPNINIRGI